jgi:TrmH family RNA methyltransferase
MKPKIVRVYSENATFQRFEALQRNREKRHQGREFVVEGVRQINLAVARGWTINGWLYAPEQLRSAWATAQLAQSGAVVHYQLAEHLVAKLSSKEEPSELLALVAIPPDDLGRIPLCPDLLVLVGDRLANPGNLGTILRSADALGAHGLILTGHAVDLYDPETVSASVGTIFTLPAVRLAAPRDLEPWFETIRARIGPVQLIGTSAKAEQALDQHDWKKPTILVIGNETSGLSAHYRARCDTLVTIPQTGAATSLNVACATTVLLYEIQRQRRAKDDWVIG